MEVSRIAGDDGAVSAGSLEALLEAAVKAGVSSAAGLFGPDSMSWKINREAALFLGAGRAALLQLAHPWVAAALADHSTVMSRPIARFHSTFRIVFTMIFGSLDQALAAARHLYNFHTRIQGELREDVAAYRRGSHYEANRIGALRWVYATLVESAVLAHECAAGPLDAVERERYLAESRLLASLFGIPGSALPENWAAFAAYNAEMHASSLLGVGSEARAMAAGLLAGAGSWIHPPHWYRSLTAAWLPERLRAEFDLRFGPAERRAADAVMRRLPAIYRALPAAVRYTGPWHEARARLSGRRPGWTARWGNRFWVGQPLLPFGADARQR